MKKYTIELSDDLSTIYEDIAKMNKIKVEKCISLMLKQVIESMLNKLQPQNKEKSEGGGK